LKDYAGFDVPFLMLTFPIMMSAWWGGFGPGILATIITAVAANYFQYPYRSFEIYNAATAIQLVIHIALGIAMSWLIAVRNQAQVRTEYQRKWLGVMLSSIGDAVIATDTQGVIMYVNPIAQNLMGYAATEIMGHKIESVFKILDSKTHRPITSPVAKVLEKGERVVMGGYSLLVNRRGTEIPIDDAAAPIVDDEGELKGAVMVFRDITERRKSERELAHLAWQLDYQVQKLNNVVSSVPGVVWEATKSNTGTGEMQMSFVSNYAEQMLGFAAGEWKNDPSYWLKVVHPEDQEKVSHEFGEIMTTGRSGVVEFRAVKKNGEPIWVQSQVIAIVDRKGKVIGMRGVTTDISERKELEKRKDQFIGMASHELKTPVTTIKVFSQMMEKSLSKSGQKDMAKYAHRMNEQIDKLTSLIGDMLDISKIEAGKLPFEYQLFSLDEMVQETVENMLSVTGRNPIIVGEKCDCSVYGDRERVGQVIINLLTNAIKYSPAGSKIIVNASAKQNLAVVSVQDFGIGISKEYQSKVFDRFFQADDPVEKTFPGLGIGLYITSEIVKRHGGKIWVKSERGQGSTFYFTLPLDKPVNAPQ
jgi:PAS domain S-box-containing protein